MNLQYLEKTNQNLYKYLQKLEDIQNCLKNEIIKATKTVFLKPGVYKIEVDYSNGTMDYTNYLPVNNIKIDYNVFKGNVNFI